MNIDLLIIGFYIIITLAIKYRYSFNNSVETIQAFALGNHYFTTSALTATITAIYVSGSSFLLGIEYGYYEGLLKLLSSLGIVLNIIIMIYIFLPRMSEFLGELSIPTSLRRIFGKKIGLISAIFSAAIPIGMIAMQLKVLSSILVYFTAIDPNILAIIFAIIMVLYSIMGGIGSVIVTDMFQFISFIVVVIFITVALWYNLSHTDPDVLWKIYNHATTFEYVPRTDYVTLFLLFLLPRFEQAFFQRITASKNIEQAQKVFKYSSYIFLIYIFLAVLIGAMLFLHEPNLASKSDIFPFLIQNFTFPGLAGIICVAIIAMSLSTADSYLNAFGVIFSHDICKQINILMSYKTELFLARLSTILIGILSTLAAIYSHNILQILVFARNFYDPIISAPLILAILGFRSSERAVLIGMSGGFATVIVWKSIQYYFPETLIIDSLIPSVLMSYVSFLSAHYALREKGGWNKNKNISSIPDNVDIISAKIGDITKDLVSFCKTLSLRPGRRLRTKVSPVMISLLGVLIISSYYVISLSDPNLSLDYPDLYIMKFISYGFSTLLILYPLYSNQVEDGYKETLLLYGLLYLLYSSSFLTLSHNFSTISLAIFLINLLALSFFSRIFIILLIATLSMSSAIMRFSYVGHKLQYLGGIDPAFITGCGAFALAIIILSFVNQHQSGIDTKETNENNFERLNSVLKSQIDLRENNLKSTLNIQADILRNINDKIRVPMSNLRSNIDLLVDNWKDPYMENHMPDIIYSIKNSMNKLFQYSSKMLDLSKYQTSKMILGIKSINLKELLKKVLNAYDNTSLHYYDNVPSYIECDELKITQLIEQIISNSNSFKLNSKIQVSVTIDEDLILNHQSWEQIKISVRDNGMTYTESELKETHNPFLLNSKTKNNIAGQGMGLAIAYEIVNYHQGNIWVTNNKNEGLTIHIQLPIKQPQYKFLGRDTYYVDKDHAEEDINVENILTRIKKLDNKFNNKIPKILMIDDESIILKAGETMIEALGFNFKGIDNPEDAIKYISSKEFDCDIILLDMMMGTMTGFDVMKKLCKILEGKKVPVIIQSGLSHHDNEVKQTMQLGAVELLNKPYNKNELDDVLKKYLGL